MSSRKADYKAMGNMLWALEELVRRPAGYRLSVLAERLDVSVKTMRRYVTHLQELASWSELMPDICLEGGHVRLERASKALNVRAYQYVALYAIARQIKALDEALLGENTDLLLARVGEEVPDDLPRRINRSFYYQPVGPKDYGEQGDVMDEVLSAVVNQRVARLVYRKPGQSQGQAFEFEPWSLVMYQDGLYIHGLRRSDGQRRTLAIDRIEDAERLKDVSFDIPADFKPEEYFGGRFGLFDPEQEPEDIVLAFDPGAAVWARERRWPGFVSWGEHDDGRPLLRLRLVPHHEVVNWLVGWTHKVEVLEPASLRQALIQLLTRTLDLYRSVENDR